MVRRLLIAALAGLQVACGGAGGGAQATASPNSTCKPLQVTIERYDLSTSIAPTAGFDPSR